MGRTVYLTKWMIDFYTSRIHVGKYTVRPMDPSWELTGGPCKMPGKGNDPASFWGNVGPIFSVSKCLFQGG